jgi:hypothetical protein
MHPITRTMVAVTVIAAGFAVGACAVDATSSPLAVSSRSSFDPVPVDPCNPDITAPVIASVSANPNTLWAPNHKMNAVTVTTSATDFCSGVPTCAISSVTSNEPINGLGDGNTAPDWIVTGANTLQLRSERAGVGSGRVYTIGVTCTDASLNSATSYTTVTVAHDQGKRG